MFLGYIVVLRVKESSYFSHQIKPPSLPLILLRPGYRMVFYFFWVDY